MEKKPQRTAQRLAVYEYVIGNKSHPSIKDIYRHVSEKLYNVSLTTIYNTMDLLKERGEVVELPIDIHGEGRRFDSNIMPHDHLICTSCGVVYDVELDVDHTMLVTEEHRHGFDIKRIFLTFQGICARCRGEEDKNSSNN